MTSSSVWTGMGTNLLYGSIIPSFLTALLFLDVIALGTFKLLLLISFILFVIIPLIYKFSYRFQSSIVFLNFVDLPAQNNFDDLDFYGLEGARNLYLTSEEGITLGVWHILPQYLARSVNKTGGKEEIDKTFDALLASGDDVVLYNHGNAGSRACLHRIGLYKVLRRNYHVITYDYRSYADSTKTMPTEERLVNDCTFMIKWIMNKKGSTGHLYIWGHSLGTSITTHALFHLRDEKVPVSGVILESPFTNFRDEISRYPLAKMFSYLPWFTYTIIEPMQANKFTFESDRFILEVNCPILILHAEDDLVVPAELGKKLYQIATSNRKPKQGTVSLHIFEARHQFGHNFIYKARDLPQILEKFATDCTRVNFVEPLKQVSNYEF